MSNFWPYVIIGITAGSVYGLAGSGLVLTYKTSGIFNFAHGTVAALMAYVFYDLRVRSGLPWPIALALCVLVLAPAMGWLLEKLAGRISDAPVAMKVVATVGLLVGTMQFIIIRYGPGAIYTTSFLPTKSYRLLGINVGYDQTIIVAISIAGMLGLTALFSSTRTGKSMQAVVDQPDLLSLTGTSPAKVRRRAWYIGTAFAGLSGVLLAPSVGLDPEVLTLLVVQAFGAAAIGRFTSIPMTYVGGLTIGVLAAFATKYVATVAWLAGVPASMPFIVLFVVLVAAPRGWLADFANERKPRVVESMRLPRVPRLVMYAVIAVLVLRAPYLVGAHLPSYSTALAYVIIFLSLALLMRTSGQVSLAQLSFAAVGSVASGKLAADAGVPWLIAVLLGALIAVPIGGLLAIPAIRRSGLYLALATFGFAVLLEQLIYPTGIMWGGGSGTAPAPRPSFATGDRAYYYVLVAFVVAAIGLVVIVQRSRLGRLLRAMSDSPTALETYGTSITAIKVIVFCIAAFLAGLGGALLGPVTKNSSPASFSSFSSLTLLVVSVLAGRSEIGSSVIAAILLVVVPGYITNPSVNNYLPLAFAVGALMTALTESGLHVPARLARAASATRRRPHRSPLVARARAARSPEPA